MYHVLQFHLTGFVTPCYAIFSLSMVQAMEIFVITYQVVTKPRENYNFKLDIVFLFYRPFTHAYNAS